jgi:hypothetical protein
VESVTSITHTTRRVVLIMSVTHDSIPLLETKERT